MLKLASARRTALYNSGIQKSLDEEHRMVLEVKVGPTQYWLGLPNEVSSTDY